MTYYSFPFSPLLESKLSLKESIVSHVKFLLHIREGEFSGKENIECKIWNYIYSSLDKSKVKLFLLDSIQKEERLKDVKIRNEEQGILYDDSEELLKFTIEGIYLNNQKFVETFEIRINIDIK